LKVLHIQECYFELPNDFNGSFGDALMLMANRAVQAEVYKEVYDRTVYDVKDYFISERKGKAVVAYEFTDIN